MTAEDKLELCTSTIELIRGLFASVDVHIPAIVVCIHADGVEMKGHKSKTHVICEENETGQLMGKALNDAMLKDGAIPDKQEPIGYIVEEQIIGYIVEEQILDDSPKKPERKRPRCSNAPDITWSSLDKKNHSHTTPAPSQGATERSQTNGDEK